MTFAVAMMIAVSYWGARDVQVPCHPVEQQLTGRQMHALDVRYQDIPNIDIGNQASARTDIGRCVIMTGPRLRDDIEVPDLAAIPSNRAEYCQDIVHEVGHIAGLTHSYGGVMSADGSGHTPWGCRHPRKWLRLHRARLRHA